MGILIPTFSFESGTSGKGEIGSEMNTPIDPEMRITKVESKLDVLKAKYSRPFFDIDASYTLLVSDLTKLNEKVRVFSSQLGYSRNEGKGLKRSVIGSIQGITAQVQQNQEVMKRSMDDLTDEFGDAQGATFQLEFWLDSANKTFDTINKRFGYIKPLLNWLMTENKEIRGREFLLMP